MSLIKRGDMRGNTIHCSDEPCSSYCYSDCAFREPAVEVYEKNVFARYHDANRFGVAHHFFCVYDVAFFPPFYPYGYNAFSFITVIHAVLGGVTLILAIWLIASWHFQRFLRSCARRKKAMRLVFVMWIIALLLGILLYLYLYTTLVPWLH
jgi:hypothetical protein